MEAPQGPVKTFDRTLKPIIRPAITVDPIGHVQLTSGVLFPRENSTIDPVRILFYRFRIIDINIGMIQYQSTSKDGQELWSRVQEFTGKDVLSRKIRYVANIMQPEKFQPKLRDTVFFLVTHLNNTNEQAILELPVNFSRIELILARNEPLTIFQTLKTTTVAVPHGNCITRWNLEAQSIPINPMVNIYFTITKMPKHGHIYLLEGSNDKVYLGIGSVFRQRDVNLGKLFYKFRRVIDDWSSATLRIEKGLIYVKDEFRFRIHVHSYRPSVEHVFDIDILESSADSSTSLPMLTLPLQLRKQVGVTNKSGVLNIKSPLIEIKESRCLKLPNFNFKSSPTFEYMIEILSKPNNGKIHILKPNGACSINTNVLPVGLLPKGMLVYVPDRSYHLSDEFKFRIICHDSRGLFESATDDQIERRLLILKQVIRGVPPIGSIFTGSFHIRIQPDKYFAPQIDLQINSGRLSVKISKDLTRPQNRLYLSCPQTDSSDDCTGGYFTEQGKEALLSTIELSTTSQHVFSLIPHKTDSFCARCFVSDGLYSFHKEIQNRYFKTVVNLQRELSISTTLNGTTSIFFKMALSEDVNPADISVRAVRPSTSKGCVLLDNRVTDKFDYSAVLRYRVLYWQCKPVQNQMFGIPDLDEMQTATLLDSTLSAENFDALSLEVTTLTTQGENWSGRVNVKVRLTMNDLSSLDEFQMHPTIETPLLQINPDPLSMVLVNPGQPKIFDVRISLSPIQLRDILSHRIITLPHEAFYKVLKMPCQCKMVLFVSRLRVDNVMAFSSNDLTEGRVYLIPSANCSSETADNQLNLLQQITNSRGLTHQQPLIVRFNISSRRHVISFRNMTIGVGEKISMKESNLHMSEIDNEGSASTIIDCQCFSTEKSNNLGSNWTPTDEIFILEEPPTCGKLISKRLNRTIGIFSLKNVLENDIYFEHNGRETCDFASITISGIIRGEVETRVPRQKMVFFVLVREVPVHLVRLQSLQMWRGSVGEISAFHLAAQLTAAYEDMEVSNYIPIEYRVKSVQGGVISSSTSEVIPITIFTHQDIRQQRVFFHHHEKSSNASFKFTLVHRDYESPIHQFKIEIKAVRRLSFQMNPIVVHFDALTPITITNINAVLVLNNNENYDLLHACENGGLQVSYVISNIRTACYFVLGSSLNSSNSAYRAESFTQCDIYHGQVQICCSSTAPNTISLRVKARVIEPISSIVRRAIYESDDIELKIIIRERVNGINQKIVRIRPEKPQDFRLESVKLFDVGYSIYWPTESSVFVMKVPPIHGDILCDSKVMKVGDALCKSPVFKFNNGLGILDKVSLEVFPNSGKSSHPILIKMPVIIQRGNLSFAALENSKRTMKRFVQITMNNSFVSLNSELPREIDGAMYTITKFPSFGGVYFSGSLLRSFSLFSLLNGDIYYERNVEYLSDFTQDHFHIVICTDWPECRIYPLVLEIQIDAFPLEKRIIFHDLVYDSQKLYIPIKMELKSLGYEAFVLTLKPNFGRILSNNIDILKLGPYEISDDRISYYRAEWNMSNDEFVLQRQQPPTVMIFRVINAPLIRFKTLYVPYGKEFALNARMLDLSLLQDSVDRLKKNGFMGTSLSLHQALRFSISTRASIGEFFKSHNKKCETNELMFTYKELSDEVVRFKNYDNITVRTTSEGIKISISAPMFMAPQKIPIKISIMSTQYNAQDNVLLSDFVDENGAIDSQIVPPIYNFKHQEFGNLKIWFAIAVGIVCFVVCIFVTVAYFYLRRWRNQRRIQARYTTEPIVYIDSYRPKLPQMTDREDEPLPSPITLVPLSVIRSQNADLQTNTEAVLTDQIVHWERQNMMQDIPPTSFYVIQGEALVEGENTAMQPIPCVVSKTPLTLMPLTQSQLI